jgi:hypothetical protein
MAKMKFEMLIAQQQTNTVATIPTTPSTLIKLNEGTSSNLNLIDQTSIGDTSSLSKHHGFIRQSSFPSPLSPILSASPNTHSSPDNKSGKSHCSGVVGRVSCSLEKSMFKILNHQDWNILHEGATSSAAVPSISEELSSQRQHQIDRPPSLERESKENSPRLKKASQSLANFVKDIVEEEALLTNNNECTTTLEPMLVGKNGEELNPNQQKESQNESFKDVEETSLVIGGKRSRSDEPHFFIEEAIKELLRSRRILRCSYVYGYYLDTFGHRKFIFELIQTEFEGKFIFV